MNNTALGAENKKKQTINFISEAKGSHKRADCPCRIGIENTGEIW